MKCFKSWNVVSLLRSLCSIESKMAYTNYGSLQSSHRNADRMAFEAERLATSLLDSHDLCMSILTSFRWKLGRQHQTCALPRGRVLWGHSRRLAVSADEWTPGTIHVYWRRWLHCTGRAEPRIRKHTNVGRGGKRRQVSFVECRRANDR